MLAGVCTDGKMHALLLDDLTEFRNQVAYCSPEVDVISAQVVDREGNEDQRGSQRRRHPAAYVKACIASCGFEVHVGFALSVGFWVAQRSGAIRLSKRILVHCELQMNVKFSTTNRFSRSSCLPLQRLMLGRRKMKDCVVGTYLTVAAASTAIQQRRSR